MTTEPIDITGEDAPSESNVARRGIFVAAAGGAAALLAACGKGSGKEATLTPGDAPSRTPQRQQKQGSGKPERRPAAAPVTKRQPTSGDLTIGSVAASLEVLAVNTYGAALDAAGSGALGEVPPAVAEFVTTAQSQHQAALDAWNGVLTASGQQAVTWAPPDLEATVNDMFAQVTDVAGAANLALTLESIAAATYLDAISKLESTDAIALAGSIYPIDRQHISVLLFALGQYPVPETFANTDQAYAGGAPPMMPGTR